MSKNLSAKYHQENKKKTSKKKLVKDIKIFLKTKRKKRQYGRECYKIANVEKQKLVEYRKKYYRMRKKTLYHNYKKVF